MPICGIATIIIVGILGLMGLYGICSVVFADDSKNSTINKNDDNNDKNKTKDTKSVSEINKKNTLDDSIRIKRRLNSPRGSAPEWNSPLTDPQEERSLYSEYISFVENSENRSFVKSLRNFPMYAEIFAAGFGYEKLCRESLGVDSDSSAFRIFAKYANSFANIGDPGFPDEFYRTFGDALHVRFLCEKTEFYSHLETPEFDKCKQDLDQVLGTFKGIAKKIARVTPYPGFSYNSENEEMKSSIEGFIKSSKSVVEHSVDVFKSMVEKHNVLTEKLIAEEKRKEQEKRAMSQKSTEDEIIATLSVGTSQLSSSAAEGKDLNSPVW